MLIWGLWGLMDQDGKKGAGEKMNETLKKLLLHIRGRQIVVSMVFGIVCPLEGAC